MSATAWDVLTAATDRPSAASFQAAVERARFHVETLEPTLALQYESVIRAAGVRAAAQFRRNAALVAAAGDIPYWTVPPVDSLVDTVQVTQDLLGTTAETREAAAVAATRPIMSAMGVSFSLEAPMVKDLVGRTGVRAAKISIPGLRDAVIAAMTEAFAEGLAVDQAADLILSKTDDLAGYQATMLARTDLIGTANGGSILAAKIVYPTGTITKRWVNATNSDEINDGRIRPTHLEANGQTVPLDGYFVIGGDRLLYPGDPTGADDEVINCRCTLVYDEPLGDLTATGWDESKHPREGAGRREGGRFRGGQPADVRSAGVDDTEMREWIRGDVEGLRDIVERDGTSPEDATRIIGGYEQQMVDRYHEEYDRGAQTIAVRLNGMAATVTARPPADSFSLSDPDGRPGGVFSVGLPEDPNTNFTVWTDSDGALSEWQDGVGDVLDVTDPDFFGDDAGKAGRYIATLRAVRGDVITGDTTLYRGMSGAERAAWDQGASIPAGKFFTSEPTANMAQDVAGEFPELHTFEVARNDSVETDPGVYQLIRPATLKDGRIAADHGDVSAAMWDESRHPRFERGVHEGGRFRGGSEAAHRAREAKAMRDSTELDWAPDLEQHDRTPVETISEDDRGRARRALSYTSDDGLSLRVRDAQTWEDLVPDDRLRLSRYLEDLQDETDHENLQPLIDRLKRAGVEPTLPPRGSYPVTAAAWDESRHPREESGRREGGRFRGGVVVHAIEDPAVVPESPPDTISVTGRSLKEGDRFTDGKGREWEVVTTASGRGRYMRVRSVPVAEHLPSELRIMKASQKVDVKAADHPAAAKRIAKVSVSHVGGEYGKVFDKSPGPGTKVTLGANIATEEVGRVLTLPDDLQKIALKETRAQTMGGAFYSSRNRQTGEITPVAISVRAIDPEGVANIPSVVHHEMGHYIDAIPLGKKGVPIQLSASQPHLTREQWLYASEARDPLVAGPVMDAIDRSRAGQRVTDMVSAPSMKYSVVRNAGLENERMAPVDREHARYIAESPEKFARAYEQYISTKNGVRAERYAKGAALPLDDVTLDPGDSYSGFHGWYWEPDDFAPISAEFDAMFGRLGWSKR